MTEEFIKCPQCSESIRNPEFCHHCGWSRSKVSAAGEDSTQDSDPSIELLMKIEKNTRRAAEQSKKAADWTRFLAMPLLVGLIVGILMALNECS